MIPNPTNVLEMLQNDVAAQVNATAPFTTIIFPDGTPWSALTEDEGDIKFEFERMISVIGLSVVVRAPDLDVAENTDIPGPLFSKATFDVRIFECPQFNRVATGTQIRIAQAIAIVTGTLHGFQPASIGSPIYNTTVRNPNPERWFTREGDTQGTIVFSRHCAFVAPEILLQIT
jgi:hypothetical protein